MSPRKLYWLAGVAVAAELAAYLLWRRSLLRRGATGDEAAA